MSEILLNSLDIQNFRAFRHLYVERVGRVNLIVGKNNVGKTSVLEALYIYAHQGTLSALWDIIEPRNEGKRPDAGVVTTEVIEAQIAAMKHLFHTRRDLASYPLPIQIGSATDPTDKCTVSVSWKSSRNEGTGDIDMPRVLVGLTVRRGSNVQVTYNFDQTTLWLREQVKGTSCQFIRSQGLEQDQVHTLWDATTLTSHESDVLTALQVIEPDIDQINLRNEYNRVAFVKLRFSGEVVRLHSLGEGMNRLFGIALALIHAQDGFFLVDEIENGLHYSVQPDVWRLIFEVAQRLNVQVFATTHSSDCVRAFQHIAQEHPTEGMLIRLGRKNGDIVASLYDEDLLRMAVEQDVEVR